MPVRDLNANSKIQTLQDGLMKKHSDILNMKVVSAPQVRIVLTRTDEIAAKDTHPDG